MHFWVQYETLAFLWTRYDLTKESYIFPGHLGGYHIWWKSLRTVQILPGRQAYHLKGFQDLLLYAKEEWEEDHFMFAPRMCSVIYTRRYHHPHIMSRGHQHNAFCKCNTANCFMTACRIHKQKGKMGCTRTLSAKEQLNLTLAIYRETLQDLWYLQIGLGSFKEYNPPHITLFWGGRFRKVSHLDNLLITRMVCCELLLIFPKSVQVFHNLL